MPSFDAVDVLLDHFLGELDQGYVRLYGKGEAGHRDTMRLAATMAVEIIASSDAHYHNVEHTMLVTLVGQQILRGKQLSEGTVDAKDWVHCIVSLLCHDIGYVRGILQGDRPDRARTGKGEETVDVPPGATDAFLTPYHIDRGQTFVRARFEGHPVIDPEVVARNLERTRFPVPKAGDSLNDSDFPGLVRAADLIGQLADLDYLRKLPCLYQEFAETGAAKAMGYRSPDDLRRGYPDFFWKMVNGHIGRGLDYLRVTREGRQWEANLYSHVFAEEHRAELAECSAPAT
jgi:hypothetical protein